MNLKWALPLILFGLFLSCDADDYPNADIPSVVLNEFRSSYPEASEVEWEQVKDLYEVDFELGGKDAKAMFQISGDILREKQDINLKALPREVIESLEKEFGKGKIEDPEMVISKDQRYYQVEISKFLFNKEMVIDEQGVNLTSVSFWN